jgi:hypothetical protein
MAQLLRKSTEKYIVHIVHKVLLKDIPYISYISYVSHYHRKCYTSFFNFINYFIINFVILITMGNCCSSTDVPDDESNIVSLILGRDKPYKVRNVDTTRVTYAKSKSRIKSGAVVMYRNRYYNIYTTLYGTDDKYLRYGIPQRDFVYLTEQLRSSTSSTTNKQYTHCVSPNEVRVVLIDNSNIFIDSCKITEIDF